MISVDNSHRSTSLTSHRGRAVHCALRRRARAVQPPPLVSTTSTSSICIHVHEVFFTPQSRIVHYRAQPRAIMMWHQQPFLLDLATRTNNIHMLSGGSGLSPLVSNMQHRSNRGTRAMGLWIVTIPSVSLSSCFLGGRFAEVRLHTKHTQPSHSHFSPRPPPPLGTIIVAS
jgi:hypothetical protein